MTFVRHIMKASSPEQIQAAVLAGTLQEPYIAQITQDSSVSGYENKGIYIQQSASGTPDIYDKEHVDQGAMYLTNSPSIEYTADGQAVLLGQLFFGAGYDDIPSGYDNAAFGVIPANKWEERAEELSTDSSVEIINSFLNPEEETYDATYVAEAVNNRSADGSTGNYATSNDLRIEIPYGDDDNWNPERNYYIVGGFYADGSTGSEEGYNLGTYTVQDHLVDDPEDVEIVGVINGVVNNTFTYWGGLTQNDIYTTVRIGAYLKSVFDTYYAAAHALDPTLTEEDYLVTFRDVEEMMWLIEMYPYQDGTFYGFDSNEYLLENIPGYVEGEGDVLVMHAWLVDASDNETDVPGDFASDAVLALTAETDDLEVTLTAGDSFPSGNLLPAANYDHIVYKLMTQADIADAIENGDLDAGYDINTLSSYVREHNIFDGSLGESDSSTFNVTDNEDNYLFAFAADIYYDEGEDASVENVHDSPRMQLVFNNAPIPAAVLTVGEGNDGYFDTGCVPGDNTVVKFRGHITDDGGISHGVLGGLDSTFNPNSYRIFGYGGNVYFDRAPTGDPYRISESNGAAYSGAVHDFEFGNFYIKVDGTTVATGTTVENSNVPSSIFIFAGSCEANGDSSVEGYAGAGTSIEYFEIWDDLGLVKRYVPMYDENDGVYLHDEVDDVNLYPAGENINITYALVQEEPEE